jgi:trans-2,3-dihydro-3-hydroxyanthranilate isomerase
VTHPLHVVDVFAESLWAGNPLAVVLDAGDLSSESMQQVALEMNYSETSFVTGPDAGQGFPVRLFTPTQELPFAGHPTLGTAWVLRRELAGERPEGITLSLGVGSVPVRFEEGADGDIVWLEAPPVTLGATCTPVDVAQALGLEPGDLEAKAPVQAAEAGIQFTIVPLRSLDALRRAKLDPTAFEPLVARGLPPFVYLFCTEGRHPADDLSARMFFDADGVREDPATGSATACLGFYLLEHGVCGEPPLALRVGQGHEIRRPSTLYIRAARGDATCRVEVGGRVIPTVEGTLL